MQNPARLASAWTTNRGSRRIDSRVGRVQHNGSPFAIGESWRGNVTDDWAANFLIGRLFIVELGNSNLSVCFSRRIPSIGAYRVPYCFRYREIDFTTLVNNYNRSTHASVNYPRVFATRNLNPLSKLYT